MRLRFQRVADAAMPIQRAFGPCRSSDGVSLFADSASRPRARCAVRALSLVLTTLFPIAAQPPKQRRDDRAQGRGVGSVSSFGSRLRHDGDLAR